jgi:hypothetical protein
MEATETAQPEASSTISESQWAGQLGNQSTPQETNESLPQETEQQEQPIEQVETQVQQDPNQQTAPTQYTIKTWDGQDKVVTPDWMKGYFQARDNAELSAIIENPANAAFRHCAKVYED